jgi:hypothetical protein
MLSLFAAISIDCLPSALVDASWRYCLLLNHGDGLLLSQAEAGV